jgi:hypothetical protein
MAVSSSPTKTFENIIVREVERLDTESRLGGLEMESVRKLEILARSWRAYSASKIERAADDIGTLSAEDLIALARGAKIEAESEPHDAGEGSGQESSSGSTLEDE